MRINANYRCRPAIFSRLFVCLVGKLSRHSDHPCHPRHPWFRFHTDVPGEADEQGQRYTVDFPMTGMLGRAIIRSIWIIRSAENFPRLVSCYIL